MGSVYTTCPNCGDSLGGYWRMGEDTQEDLDAGIPRNLREKLIEHAHECQGSTRSGAAVAFGLMGMAFAIQRRYSAAQSFVERVRAVLATGEDPPGTQTDFGDVGEYLVEACEIIERCLHRRV